jgi:hypothetical protein
MHASKAMLAEWTPEIGCFRRKHTKFHKIILNDRKVNLVGITETLKISKKCIEHIVHKYLDMLKLFANWLQRLLKIDQNQQRGAMFSDIQP